MLVDVELEPHTSNHVIRLQQGIYQTTWFGVTLYTTTPSASCWHTLLNGVCDSLENFLEVHPQFATCEDNVVVTLTPISKCDEPEEYGWRWHKWGEYIGHQNPQREYLYDEPEIEQVYIFQVDMFKA